MSLRKYLFEFLGTALLLIAVVGSSFMAGNLTDDNGLALLINAATTALMLKIIIKLGAPVTGAHFNPVVTLAKLFTRKIDFSQSLFYLVAQFLGGISGVIIANVMFDSGMIVKSTIMREGTGVFIGEILATAGLVYLALISNNENASKLIPLWIFAAYFFTSSTSFANPAVTLSRVFTESASGISLDSVPMFFLAQIVGSMIGIFGARLDGKNE